MCCDNSINHNEKLRQFIYDEDRIVTVIWLANKLKISADESKKLLVTFVANERKSQPDNLGVSYVLSGKLKDGDINSIIAVEEEALPRKKELFNSIFSQIILSVQNSKHVDLKCVGMVEDDPIDYPLLGAFIGRNCVKRNLKNKKVLPELDRVPPTDKAKASHLFDKPALVKHENGKPAKEVVVKQELKENSAKTSKLVKPANQKGGIASFFSKVPNKPDTKREVKKEPNDENKTIVPETIGTVKEEKAVVEESMEVEETSEKDKIKKEDVLYDSGTDEEAHKIEEINKKNNISPKAKKPAKRPRKGKTSEPSSKRRKRIVQENDSDSDDIFASEKNVDESVVIEDSDEEPVYKKPAPVLAPKNKRRKLVDKTYTDEEGYLVTKQEWVYESGSDDEDKGRKNTQTESKVLQEVKPEPVKEKQKSSSSQESTPPKTVKGKKGLKPSTNQPTLMSFFKKK